MNFDGSSDCIGHAEGSDARLPINGPYTIEAEIKPLSSVGAAGIVGWGEYYSGSEKMNTLRLDGPEFLISDWGQNDLSAQLESSLADGHFHHVATTFDGTSRSIFVDYMEVAKKAARDYSTVNVNFCIGRANGGGNFAGQIKNLKIWNFAKTFEMKSCTRDTKECPDGSAVSRDGRDNCKFFPCPTPASTEALITTQPSQEATCTQEVMECPDGSAVSRDPFNSCEFHPCPTSTSISTAGSSTTPPPATSLRSHSLPRDPTTPKTEKWSYIITTPKATNLRSFSRSTTTAGTIEEVSNGTSLPEAVQEGNDSSGFWSLGKLSALALAVVATAYFCYKKLCVSNTTYYTPKRSGIEMSGRSITGTQLGRAYQPPCYLPAE